MKAKLPIIETANKYDSYVLGVAGSKSMPGAALLAAKAAFRAGSGLVRLYTAADTFSTGYAPFPELLLLTDVDALQRELSRAHAVFIGCGLGEQPELAELVFASCKKPLVIDADALNIIAKTNIKAPFGAVLTPHRGELERLLGGAPCNLPKACQAYVDDNLVHLLVKGPETVFFSPGKEPLSTRYGHPAMATAGMGDVLTGVLAAVLARGLCIENAIHLALQVHGRAAHLAVAKLGPYSLMSSDVIDCLPCALIELCESR